MTPGTAEHACDPMGRIDACDPTGRHYTRVTLMGRTARVRLRFCNLPDHLRQLFSKWSDSSLILEVAPPGAGRQATPGAPDRAPRRPGSAGRPCQCWPENLRTRIGRGITQRSRVPSCLSAPPGKWQVRAAGVPLAARRPGRRACAGRHRRSRRPACPIGREQVAAKGDEGYDRRTCGHR